MPSMATNAHAFDFLARPVKVTSLPLVCVVFGDESFLKRLVLQAIQQSLVEGDDSDFASGQFEGADCQWRDVGDELGTMSLFGSDKRTVFVSAADDFVTRCRTQLEDYVEAANEKSILVLDVKSWPGNTRLAKSVAKKGLAVECRLPLVPRSKRNIDVQRVVNWLIAWAEQSHQLRLDSLSARQLYDLVGDHLGLIDQELAKLAVTVEDVQQVVTPRQVQDIVGGWRVKTAFDLINAAADGNAGEALRQLDRLLQSGEHPLAMFGAIAWSLRRYAVALRAIEVMERKGQRVNFEGALRFAGFRDFKPAPSDPQTELKAAESRLRQIGRGRANEIFRWLLDTDLQMKGSHSQERRARMALEFLLLKLAKQTASANA